MEIKTGENTKKDQKCCVCGKEQPIMIVKHSVIGQMPFYFCFDHKDWLISQDLTGEVFLSHYENGKLVEDKFFDEK